MKRRSTRKSSAPEISTSPVPTESPDQSPNLTPTKFEFNFDTNFKSGSFSSLKKYNKEIESNVKKTKSSSGTKKSSLILDTVSPPSVTKSLSSISELKELSASKLDDLKRYIDCSHSEIMKDMEASSTRLRKRFKIQSQTCQQMMDGAEKEYKKIMDQIDEKRDAMKASYMELIAETQANTSRVCKTTIPELLQSFEKSIEGLRSRYGVAST